MPYRHITVNTRGKLFYNPSWYQFNLLNLNPRNRNSSIQVKVIVGESHLVSLPLKLMALWQRSRADCKNIWSVEKQNL